MRSKFYEFFKIDDRYRWKSGDFSAAYGTGLTDEEKIEFFNSFIYRVVLFDDYIYIFYNTSPEYPTKVKLEKEELNALRELSHPKAEKDAENKESTLFEPIKFKLGACGGERGI